jgi:hypothetical protein
MNSLLLYAVYERNVASFVWMSFIRNSLMKLDLKSTILNNNKGSCFACPSSQILWADCLENLGASTSHSSIVISGLWQGWSVRVFFFSWDYQRFLFCTTSRPASRPIWPSVQWTLVVNSQRVTWSWPHNYIPYIGQECWGYTKTSSPWDSASINIYRDFTFTFYPQRLALTSSTNGSLLVDIVR